MKLNQEFVLASESPRRKQLLEAAGFKVTVFPVKVSESLEKNLNVESQIQAISLRKWQAAQRLWNSTKDHQALLLTADTMVVLEGQALGKPSDSDEAILTLARLSGRAHQVITAVTIGLTSSLKPIEAAARTEIHFRLISRQEIEEYVKTGEPLDKAGSYGIQGLGGKFVDQVDGPYDNVVGLPVDLVKKILLQECWAKT